MLFRSTAPCATTIGSWKRAPPWPWWASPAMPSPSWSCRRFITRPKNSRASRRGYSPALALAALPPRLCCLRAAGSRHCARRPRDPRFAAGRPAITSAYRSPDRRNRPQSPRSSLCCGPPCLRKRPPLKDDQSTFVYLPGETNVKEPWETRGFGLLLTVPACLDPTPLVQHASPKSSKFLDL